MPAFLPLFYFLACFSSVSLCYSTQPWYFINRGMGKREKLDGSQVQLASCAAGLKVGHNVWRAEKGRRGTNICEGIYFCVIYF